MLPHPACGPHVCLLQAALLRRRRSGRDVWAPLLRCWLVPALRSSSPASPCCGAAALRTSPVLPPSPRRFLSSAVSCAAPACRDGGSISDVRFEGITIATRYYHPSWWGAAEPIYVTALPRAPGMQVGSHVAQACRAGPAAAVPAPGMPLHTAAAGRAERCGPGRPGAWRCQQPWGSLQPLVQLPLPFLAAGARLTERLVRCRLLPWPLWLLRLQVGSVADVTFSNISATAENGIFLSGGPLVAGSAGGSEAGSSGRPATASQPGGAGAGAVGRTAGGAEMRRQQRQQQQQQQRSLRGIRMERVSVRLRQRSRFAGGCQDYRPSSNASLGAGAAAGGAHRRGGLSPGWWWPAGLDCSSGSTASVWVAGADDVRLSDVEVS